MVKGERLTPITSAAEVAAGAMVRVIGCRRCAAGKHDFMVLDVRVGHRRCEEFKPGCVSWTITAVHGGDERDGRPWCVSHSRALVEGRLFRVDPFAEDDRQRDESNPYTTPEKVPAKERAR